MKEQRRDRELPGTVPVFPLTGVLLLPGSKLPLIVFESRYLAMTRDALDEGGMIGLVQPVEPAGDPVPGDAPVYPTGCLGHIAAHSELSDGRILITLAGINRFRIVRELGQTRGYRRAEVSYVPFPDDMDGIGRPAIDRVRLLRTLRRYLSLAEMGADWEAIEEATSPTLIDSLAMVCPFEPREKQALLECPDVAARGEMLISLMEMSALEVETQGAGGKHWTQ